MSYQILYGKCFIKVGEDSFIPLIVDGANNCHEQTFRGWRRERNISIFSYSYNITGTKPMIIATREEIEKKIDAWEKITIEGNRAYAQKHGEEVIAKDAVDKNISGLQYKGDCVSIDTFRRIMRNGMKNSKTVEELNELFNVNISVQYFDSAKNSPLVVYPQTTPELVEAVKKAEKILSNEKGCYLCVDFDAEVDRVLKKYTQKRNKGKRVRFTEPEYFIIKNASTCYYYSSGNRRGTRWTPEPIQAKGYRTESEALRRVRGIVDRHYHLKDKLIVKKYINQKNLTKEMMDGIIEG